MATATQAQMIEAVKRYAYEHYEEGWDVVVECWDKADYVEVIGKARTVEGAIRKVAEGVNHITAYRREIEATAF